MSEKQLFELEFQINTTRGVLYREIGTPEGLAEWFADDVNIEGDRYTFKWEGDEEHAILLGQQEDEYIRFHWESDEEADSYFQLRISQDPLTKDLALIITDFAEPEELEGAKTLWESQVDGLRHAIGA